LSIAGVVPDLLLVCAFGKQIERQRGLAAMRKAAWQGCLKALNVPLWQQLPKSVSIFEGRILETVSVLCLLG